jgi:magnesium-protoporphyrin O-methyltransferase
VQRCVVDGALLDVGAGIGALAFELLQLGMTRATVVDASSAFLTAAAEEAMRVGRSDAMAFVHGDFLSVAAELPTADVVTLDRVICCYPACVPLLQEAARHAQRCFALSYPRGRWYVRAGMALENGKRRLRANPFRTFVHSPAEMERIIRESGFALVSRRHTWMWCADVYMRAVTDRDSDANGSSSVNFTSKAS